MQKSAPQTYRFTKYCEQFKRYPKLTTSEEIALSRRYRAGDRASGDRLVLSYMLFALHLAHKQCRAYHHLQLDDCLQVAAEAMLQAREDYDPDRGFRFGTFAVHRISARLEKYTRSTQRLVRYGTTNRTRHAATHLHHVKEDTAKRNPGATNSELLDLCKERLGVSYEELELLDARIASPDESLTSDPVAQEPLPDELVDRKRAVEKGRRHVLEQAKNSVELEIADMMLEDKSKSLASIGRRYGITRERVRQVKAKMLERISL